MPCIVTMDLVVDCECVLKFSRENSVFKREHKLQVKLLKNRFCMSIIIGLVHYPNHTFLQNYNSLKVRV